MVAEVLHNNYESNSPINRAISSAANLIQRETSCNTPGFARALLVNTVDSK